MVDFGRRAYKTACRFLRDDDTVSEIRWVEAHPDAPVLGRVTSIMSLDDENDAWLPWPLGEVEGAPRPFTGQKAPPGLLGDHVCGTDEDFEIGCVRDDDAPPVEYSASGFPLCCDPARISRGGAGASGRSSVEVVGPYRLAGGAGASGRSVPTIVPALHLYGGAGASGRSAIYVSGGTRLYGGAGASGRSVPTIVPALHLYGGAGASGKTNFSGPVYIEPALGGLEIGGASGDVFTPGYPTPGGTCATAAEIEVGREYIYSGLSSGFGVWWTCLLAAGTVYHLEYSFSDPTVTYDTYFGGSCPFPSNLITVPHGAHCLEWTTTVAGRFWYRLNLFSGPFGVTFKVATGACPP